MSFTQGLAKIKENDDKHKTTPIAKVAPELKQNNDVDTQISKTCAVLGCEESKNFNADSFFPFPEDEHLRQIWTDLTGRNNWTPTDYSYICVQHFSVDCFECDSNNAVVLINKAVPSLKLPKHVLEVEYIEEDSLDNEAEEEDYLENDYEMDVDDSAFERSGTNDTTVQKSNDYSKEISITNGPTHSNSNSNVDIKEHSEMEKPFSDMQIKQNVKVLKLFTEVQRMQRESIETKNKYKYALRSYKRQTRFLTRLREVIEMKKKILEQKKKKKSRILLSLQDKIKEDTSGLVLAMPTRHTDDLKNFALSIYKYSPQAYIYIRNALRTLLPGIETLDSWMNSGYEPRNVLTNSNLIKITTDLNETEMNCKITLR
ncbi:uncharacterized protein LOC125052162 isoform X1 [Pieris napi]|uniref:uncharacterized protein LOC125052162 isoform X1 n=1 Tax=Pieris napi TaxID=78633 RepID=UPI001FBC004B|nr:uncharacterized protein LOC125052162 isoform X1 [Pieris napi]